MNESIFIISYVLVRLSDRIRHVSPEGSSQKQAFRANRDSESLNKDFELKTWSSNLTCSWFKLPNLKIIISVFDRYRAFFLGLLFFGSPGISLHSQNNANKIGQAKIKIFSHFSIFFYKIV